MAEGIHQTTSSAFRMNLYYNENFIIEIHGEKWGEKIQFNNDDNAKICEEKCIWGFFLLFISSNKEKKFIKRLFGLEKWINKNIINMYMLSSVAMAQLRLSPWALTLSSKLMNITNARSRPLINRERVFKYFEMADSCLSWLSRLSLPWNGITVCFWRIEFHRRRGCVANHFFVNAKEKELIDI